MTRLDGRGPAKPAEAVAISRPSRALALAGLTLLLFSGCGARAKREALRACSFAPAGVGSSRVVGDSVHLEFALEIRNPGPGKAVLDSFAAIASTDETPLARLSHGRALEIASGSLDTARLQLAMSKSAMISTAMTLLMSPPDSVRMVGTAWIPGVFGGYRAHPVRAALPWSALGGKLESMLLKPR